jgi:hypothetical protein
MQTLSVKEKAVKINISSGYFGTVAEIGGGQETARHLFQAGGASNSIAKSVSAYGKEFSDHYYGQGTDTRYVGRDRLCHMLGCEYRELVSLLSESRSDKKFFAFANTVETLNFHKTNRGHGWLGVAFEGSNRNHPNFVYIHVNLHENDGLLQQYSLGTLGVNLIYAALFMSQNPRESLISLLDNLGRDRVEVDFIHVEGPDFAGVDNRSLNVQLVWHDMTPAIMFDKTGAVYQPSDMLYKKNVLVFRGVFRPINNLGLDIIEHSLEVFKRDEDYQPDNTIAFCEITLNHLKKDDALDERDFLDRVDLLNQLGQNVMVSNFRRFFRLVEYFGRFRMQKLRMVIGMPTFIKVLNKEAYTDLRGGFLEAMGKLFAQKTKIYLYPSLDSKTGMPMLLSDAGLPEDIQHVINFLQANRKILVLSNAETRYLSISGEEVANLIASNNPSFANFVPSLVADIIKDKGLFGWVKS